MEDREAVARMGGTDGRNYHMEAGEKWHDKMSEAQKQPVSRALLNVERWHFCLQLYYKSQR